MVTAAGQVAGAFHALQLAVGAALTALLALERSGARPEVVVGLRNELELSREALRGVGPRAGRLGTWGLNRLRASMPGGDR